MHPTESRVCTRQRIYARWDSRTKGCLTRFLHSSRKRYSTRWPSHEAESENVGGWTSKEVETTMDHCSCARGRTRRDALARNDDGMNYGVDDVFI